MTKTAGLITIFPLTISLLLIAITASGVVAGDSDVVVDSNGDPVKAYAPYFVEVRTSEGRRANIS